MPHPVLRATFACAFVFASAAAHAAEGTPAPVAAAPVMPVASGEAAAKPLNETQQYCQNIAAAAADARFAWQRRQLNDLEAQLKQRIADLENKEAQFKAVMAKRDEVMKRTGDTVVAIYTKMKTEAAAGQIALLDDDMASAILTQLPAKQASSILDQMPADRAAKLVGVMAGGSTLEKKS